MKKIIAVLLAAVMLLVFAACSNSQNTDDTTGDAQSDVLSEAVQDADFSKTAGLWRLDGATDTASISMDGEGSFSAYYADGTLEMSGYLEYVDEYEDGNGRYDMYDASGELFNSFYMDSDTQLHMGNDEGIIYIKGDAEAAQEDATPAVGVLVLATTFTGTTPVENNNDFNGGYYYSDKTEDGYTTIINSGFTNDIGADEDMAVYIGRCVELISKAQFNELDWTETMLGTYPAYKLSWLSGANEDTRKWTALMVTTDAYTYIYAFNTAADYADEMQETWDEALDGVTLEFPDEAQ